MLKTVSFIIIIFIIIVSNIITNIFFCYATSNLADIEKSEKYLELRNNSDLNSSTSAVMNVENGKP